MPAPFAAAAFASSSDTTSNTTVPSSRIAIGLNTTTPPPSRARLASGGADRPDTRLTRSAPPTGTPLKLPEMISSCSGLHSGSDSPRRTSFSVGTRSRRQRKHSFSGGVTRFAKPETQLPLSSVVQCVLAVRSTEDSNGGSSGVTAASTTSGST